MNAWMGSATLAFPPIPSINTPKCFWPVVSREIVTGRWLSWTRRWPPAVMRHAIARGARRDLPSGSQSSKSLDERRLSMPVFMIERNFAEQLEATPEAAAAITRINADVGVQWLFSFLSADKEENLLLV